MLATAQRCGACGVHRRAFLSSAKLYDTARDLFREEDQDGLDRLLAQLTGDEPHAEPIARLSEDLRARLKFRQREEMVRRLKKLLAAGDEEGVSALRQSLEGDPELLRLSRKVLRDWFESHAAFHSEVERLRQGLARGDGSVVVDAYNRARALADRYPSWTTSLDPLARTVERCRSEDLDGKWWLILGGLSLVPFPIGLWLVGGAASIQAQHWGPLYPRKGKAVRRLALALGGFVGTVQVILAAVFLGTPAPPM